MKNLIKKTAATTLSMIGIISMMPSALCAPDGANNTVPQNTSGRGYVDRFHAMVVGKYLNSVEDFANLQMVNKKYEDIIGDYHFNPVEITSREQSDLLSNVETYRVGENEEDFVCTFPNDKIKKLVYLPNSFYPGRFKRVLKENEVVDDNMECINDWKRTFELNSEDPMDGCRIEYTNGEKTIVFMFHPCACGVLTSPTCYNYFLRMYNIDKEELSKATIKVPEEFSVPSYATGIGYCAFKDCTNLKRINIPDSVTSIGDDAFNGCSNLTNINIPNRVKSIAESVFSGCISLTNINIPSSVKNIGRNAFKGCSSLTNVDIPDSVTSIEEFAFAECTNLTNVNIPNSVTSIEEHTFSRCTNLANVNIPNSVTTIGASAFLGCGNLTNVNIPDSVTTIGASAFLGCRNLTNVNIPDSVTEIGSHAFHFCKNLREVTIPDSVTSIGGCAFACCENLTSIKIPVSVENLDYFTFSGCQNLNHIEFNGKVYDNVDSFMNAFREYRANPGK